MLFNWWWSYVLLGQRLVWPLLHGLWWSLLPLLILPLLYWYLSLSLDYQGTNGIWFSTFLSLSLSLSLLSSFCVLFFKPDLEYIFFLLPTRTVPTFCTATIREVSQIWVLKSSILCVRGCWDFSQNVFLLRQIVMGLSTEAFVKKIQPNDNESVMRHLINLACFLLFHLLIADICRF